MRFNTTKAPHMIRGHQLNIDPKELNTILNTPHEPDYVGTALWVSESFRLNCLEAGYIIKALYPVYYIGWEMDNWGAIGEKDGKDYRLETTHSTMHQISLSPEENMQYGRAMNTLDLGELGGYSLKDMQQAILNLQKDVSKLHRKIFEEKK